MSDDAETFILLITAHDRVGIVAGVSGWLAKSDGFILDSQQYADLDTGTFFMRVEFKGSGPAFPQSRAALEASFLPVAKELGLGWRLVPRSEKLKVMIAVSKGTHCLNDLLHRWSTGGLPVEITGVVSNHEKCRALTAWHGLPYHHFPVTPETKESQEAQILAAMAASGAEMLVLARYMQVLSADMAAKLDGRCINIHHSFLPGFKGANPYHRAHARGVKLIGATAHFVTGDLDEGPIIEQEVERVDHRARPEDLVRIGRDIEAKVLARALGWVAERRVLLNGIRTVVFS